MENSLVVLLLYAFVIYFELSPFHNKNNFMQY